MDQRDSLENYFKEKIDFIDSWKKKYLLETSDQQKYFWAYILAIVNKMKLIDIQYKSQLIAFFELNDSEETAPDNDDTKMKDINIDDDQLKQDKRFMDLYSGSLIPPNNIWNIPGIDTDRDKKLPLEWAKSIGKTTLLTSAMIKVDDKVVLQEEETSEANILHNSFRRQKSDDAKRQIYEPLHSEVPINSRFSSNPGNQTDKSKDTVYYFDETKEFKPSETIFHEDEAVLLTFAEMLRKFVLESEHPQVQPYLWPWYNNHSFRKYTNQYLYLISKYNLSGFFEVSEIKQLWEEYVVTEHKDVIDEANEDQKDTNDNDDNKKCQMGWLINCYNKFATKLLPSGRNMKIDTNLYEPRNIRHQRKLV